jgi:hypothetical protein
MQTHKHWDRALFHTGMAVHSLDGKDLGKIIDLDSDRFTIEKGWFFPKEYIARFDDIADVREDDVYLAVTSDTLAEDEDIDDDDDDEMVKMRSESEWRGLDSSAPEAGIRRSMGSPDAPFEVPPVEEEYRRDRRGPGNPSQDT